MTAARKVLGERVGDVVVRLNDTEREVCPSKPPCSHRCRICRCFMRPGPRRCTTARAALLSDFSRKWALMWASDRMWRTKRPSDAA
eukprot:13042689-Heterocapsa_arctica.AAC.1